MKHPIDMAGGVSELARMLGLSAPSVSLWKRRGVPLGRCVEIERVTAGKVMRWDMRPSDWHLIWPELIGRPGAPEVPQGVPQVQEVA